MDENTIVAFLDELQKIAVAGGQLNLSSTPKTPAATPAPAARLAPTPSAKPPAIAPVAPPSGGLGAIGNPGLRSQVANTRALTGFKTPAPRVNRGTISPKPTPAPNIRSVTTMPARRSSPPQFAPGNQGMGRYVKPLSSADLGI